MEEGVRGEAPPFHQSLQGQRRQEEGPGALTALGNPKENHGLRFSIVGGGPGEPSQV